MKSEFRGCLTVDEQYADEPVTEMVESVISYLRATMESPFVAIGISPAGDSDERVYVTHGDELGQFDLIVHRHHEFKDGEYWTVTGGQPLQWLVEELLDNAGRDIEWEVELMDIAVARRRMQDEEIEYSSVEEEFGDTEHVEYNRNMAYHGMSPVPSFISDLTTEPVYDKGDAKDAGQKAQRERFA